MKSSFYSRLINGPFDDPGIYVRMARESRAFIVDPGFSTNLSAGDILKVTDIFVSHAHVDHFIGFDNILRTCLKKAGTVRLYGPEGFIDKVEGRLNGYTWNLTEACRLSIEVSAVEGGTVKKAMFRASEAFKREDLETLPFKGVLVEEKLFKVSAVVLDHKIPCLAFSIMEDYHINIDKAKLAGMGLPVGPWLKTFKMAVRENNIDSVIDIDGQAYRVEDLRAIANITDGQKLTYVVDAVGSDENIQKIIELAKGSNVLYIEAYYSNEDRDIAKERFHLTAGEAGRIARKASVGRMETFHYSPRYINDPDILVKEAEAAFRSR